MNQSKESFKETLKEELSKILPFEADIAFRKMTRSNGEIYESMTVTSQKAQVGVNLHLDLLIEQYGEEPKAMMLSSIKDEIVEKMRQIPAFDISSLTDYENIKGRLMVAPVSRLARENQTDLVTLEKCGIQLYPIIDLGQGVIGLREQHLEAYGITKEQLFSDAFANMKAKKTMTIQSLSELLGRSLSAEPDIFVISNQENRLGSAEVFVPGNMEKIAKMVGGDCFLFLSSTHELLATSAKELIDYYGSFVKAAKAMDQMVTEVNAMQVRPEDQIDNFSLFYHAADNILMKSAEYAERAELITRIDEAERWDDIDAEENEIAYRNPARK